MPTFAQKAAVALVALVAIQFFNFGKLNRRVVGSTMAVDSTKWVEVRVLSCATNLDHEARQDTAELLGKQILLLAAGTPFVLDGGELRLKGGADIRGVKFVEVLADDEYLVLEVSGSARVIFDPTPSGKTNHILVCRSTTPLASLVSNVLVEIEKLVCSRSPAQSSVDPGGGAVGGTGTKANTQSLSGTVTLKDISFIKDSYPPECSFTVEASITEH